VDRSRWPARGGRAGKQKSFQIRKISFDSTARRVSIRGRKEVMFMAKKRKAAKKGGRKGAKRRKAKRKTSMM
jgi:hypothetical protein